MSSLTRRIQRGVKRSLPILGSKLGVFNEDSADYVARKAREAKRNKENI